MLSSTNRTITRRRDLIMEIPIIQSIERRSMNVNILVHPLVEEGTNGEAMVGMIMISFRLR